MQINYEYREISYKYIIIIDCHSVKSDNMQNTILWIPININGTNNACS